MKFKDSEQVKKWFRLLPLAKRELNSKIDFYTGLISDMSRVGVADERLSQMTGSTYQDKLSSIDFYREQIRRCKEKYNNTIADWERLSKLLDSDEAAIVTAKYLKGTSWDAMEFVVYFSRRQCFRILNRAAEKLVGQSVSGDLNV